MPDAIDLEQKNREEARWRMLRVVDAGRPIAVSEQIIWRVLADIKLSLSLNTVRRELSYLRDLGLLELEGEDSETWFRNSRPAGSTWSSTTSRRRRESRARANTGEGGDEEGPHPWPLSLQERGKSKEERNLESRAEGPPHPRLWRGLSRNRAGEADNRWRGTRHPNSARWKRTLTFILSLTGRGEEWKGESPTSEAGADRSDSVQHLEN